jgi:hypothetical protein
MWGLLIKVAEPEFVQYRTGTGTDLILAFMFNPDPDNDADPYRYTSKKTC